MTAARFLSLLGDQHTFQTFDDSPDKSPALSRVLHGTLAEHVTTLVGLNARGAGVFVMVNAGDGRGRRAANVKAVRALFVDLDGSPLAPVQASPLRPHCIVESSPGRWHAYWRVADCPMDRFKPLQQVLAARFAGDPKVCDLSRVMRLPGFHHRKKDAFQSRVVDWHDAPPYTLAQVVAAFPLAAVVQLPVGGSKRRTLPVTVPEGERNATLLALAGGLVRRGHDAAAVNNRLQRLNAERCDPPLCASEVDAIAANACRYGSAGFAMLPHALTDSPEWKAAGPHVHDVVMMALRRFDGRDDCTFALTMTDFEGRKGFASDATLVSYRQAAVDAGFLVLAKAARNNRQGRTPNLYAIAPRWLAAIRSCQAQPHEMQLAPTPRNAVLHKQTALGVTKGKRGDDREMSRRNNSGAA